MKKFIFVGSQGVGKTTILNHFKQQGYNVITEVVRKLSKTGVKINEDGDLTGQKIIFNTYINELSVDGDYISDRGLIDVAAYTAWLVENGRIPNSILQEQLQMVNKFNQENPDVLYFYFPIEFSVVDDGVRSTDEHFRSSIDKYIKYILDVNQIPYIEVRGTVDERVDIVEKAIVVQNQTADSK